MKRSLVKTIAVWITIAFFSTNLLLLLNLSPAKAEPVVVINEILYDNPSTDYWEFIELYGPPNLNLDGYVLYCINGNDGAPYQTISLNGRTLDANGFLLLTNNATYYSTIYSGPIVSYSTQIQNGANDTLMLNYSGRIVDAVCYARGSGAPYPMGEGTPASTAPVNNSLARLVDGWDTHNNSNDFMILATPTPGAPNTATTPPRILDISINSGNVIEANITGEGISNVVLGYSINNGSYQSLPMILTGNNWTATIPASAGDYIIFNVSATNASGTVIAAKNYTATESSGGSVPPVINSLTHSPEAPTSTDAVVVTANITSTNTQSVLITIWYNSVLQGTYAMGLFDGTYTYTIPARPGGTFVEYAVNVTNLTGWDNESRNYTVISWVSIADLLSSPNTYNNTVVIVEGVVFVNKTYFSNTFYIQNGTDGLCIYLSNADARTLDFAIGDNVTFRGTFVNHSTYGPELVMTAAANATFNSAGNPVYVEMMDVEDAKQFTEIGSYVNVTGVVSDLVSNQFNLTYNGVTITVYNSSSALNFTTIPFLANGTNVTVEGVVAYYSPVGIEIKPWLNSQINEVIQQVDHDVGIYHLNPPSPANSSTPNASALLVNHESVAEVVNVSLTIYEPQSTTLLTEGFEDTTFPPTGWFRADVSGTAADWSRVTSGSNPTCTPYSGSAMARLNSYNAGSGNAERLGSPPIDFSTYLGGEVVFMMYHDTGYSTNNDRIYVQYSLDNTTYYDISEFKRYSPTAGWVEHRVELPSAVAGQPQVWIAFLGVSGYGNNMFIDGVTINGTQYAPLYSVYDTNVNLPANGGVIVDFPIPAGTLLIDQDYLFVWRANISNDIDPSDNIDGVSISIRDITDIAAVGIIPDTDITAGTYNIYGILHNNGTLASTVDVEMTVMEWDSVFYEDWDTLGTGWTIEANEPGFTWQFGSSSRNTSYGAYPCAYIDSDAYGSGHTQNDRLISPALDLSGYTFVTLEFYHHYRHVSSSNAAVEVSTDGIVWTRVAYFTANTPWWNYEAIDLSAYAGQPQVYIAFHYNGSDSWYWLIDNITVWGGNIVFNNIMFNVDISSDDVIVDFGQYTFLEDMYYIAYLTVLTSDDDNSNNEYGVVFYCMPNQPPVLSSPAAAPNPVEPGTSVNFTVVYTDPEGDAPQYVNVIIAGTPHNMTGPGGNGTYYFEYTFASAGIYAYSFEASDGNASHVVSLAGGNIYCSQKPVLSNGQVNPTTGYSSQPFNFSVDYSDTDGPITPGQVFVVIEGAGVLPLVTLNNVNYWVEAYLPAGTHQFYFFGLDGAWNVSTSNSTVTVLLPPHDVAIYHLNPISPANSSVANASALLVNYEASSELVNVSFGVYEIQTTTALTEGFEDTTFPPTGWLRINVAGTNEWSRSTTTPHSGTACAYISYQTTYGSDWLVSPQVTIGQNAVLEFWLRKSYSSNYHSMFFVNVSTTDTNPTSFTTMLLNLSEDTNLVTTTWQRFTADLSLFTGQNIYIGFFMENRNGNTFYLDDVLITATQYNPLYSVYDNNVNLPANDGVIVDFPIPAGTLQNGYDYLFVWVADISDDANYTNNGYIQEVSIRDIIDVSAASISPSGSISAGAYNVVGILENNGNVEATLNVSAVVMSLPYVFYENWENGGAGWTIFANNISATWVIGDEAWLKANHTDYPLFGGHNVSYIDSDKIGSGKTQNDRLISPPINLSGLTSAYLDFYHYYYHAFSSNAAIEISTDGLTWTRIGYFTASTTGWSNAVINISAYAGQPVVYIAFHYNGSYSWYWAIDEILIYESPVAQEVLNTTVENVTVPFSGAVVSFGGVTFQPNVLYYSVMNITTPDYNISNNLVDTLVVPYVPTANYMPGLLSGGVAPASGNTSTVFNFTAYYNDRDGDAALWVSVIIDGVAYDMTTTD
ncbi:MAG: choice-of-anchor J domain-containing protein, partial [Thermoplasmata archaeon]